MPTIEPSGWSGASVRLRRGDCKLDDARRLALLSSREWGPASRSRSFPRGTDETSRRPRTRTRGGWSRGCGGGSSAWGWRAGRGPLRIGADPDAPWVERDVPLHAHDAGFDLHAAVHVAAGDRPRLE